MTFLVENISGYCGDELALPVVDLDVASEWYTTHFGFAEVERTETTVVLERDGHRIGFEKNGKDASVDGAAILVKDIVGARTALENNSVSISNWRVDERDGKKFQVFFVVAPDGLCYYFFEELSE